MTYKKTITLSITDLRRSMSRVRVNLLAFTMATKKKTKNKKNNTDVRLPSNNHNHVKTKIVIDQV